MEERKPWERLPDESSPAYKAFTHYRDSDPSSRSLLRTYRETSKNKGASRASGRYQTWSRLHKWIERTALYEGHLESLRLQQNEDAHLDKLTQFRERQERLAQAATESSIRMLQLANRTLTNMLADATFKLDGRSLGPALRAAAAVADVGSRAEAHALGVEELIATLRSEDS